MQAQYYAVAYAFCLALPHDTICADAQRNVGAGADSLNDERVLSSNAQKDTADAALERRRKHLVDEYRGGRRSMLDREYRTIGQHADREPALIRDTAQAEILLARCIPGAHDGV